METNKIKSEFKKRRIRQIMATIFILPIMGMLFYASENQNSLPFGLSYDQVGIVSLVIVTVIMIFSFINWRCPSCKKYIGKKMAPNHCSNCGVKFKP